jgi:hypothetical protein
MEKHSALPFSRSDLAPLQGLHYVLPPPARQPRPDQPGGGQQVPLAELAFRQLRTPREIAEINQLRAEIQLPDAVVADPGFGAREKKEMSRGWSVRSSAKAESSARYASFQ